MLGLRKKYSLVDYEFGLNDYSKVQVERIEHILEESKGKLARFFHRLNNQFGEEELEKLDQRVIPGIVRRNARNDEVTDYYLSTTATERRKQMLDIQ